MIGGAPYSETVARLAGERREQRRYEIARDVMAALATSRETLPDMVTMAVGAADALLKALEGE